MDAYKLWVRQNQQLVASLESVANTMTWFLPERFTSSEIGLEAVASFLGLMTVINQHIIDTAPQQMQHLPSNSPEREQRQRCISLSSFLSAMKQLELLVEVSAEHYKGREKKWNILAGMEAAKACLRFLILHRNGYRMLLSGGEDIHNEAASSGVTLTGPSFTGRGHQTNHLSSSGTLSLRGRGPDGRQLSHLASLESRKSSYSRSLETKATLALMKFGENVGVKSKPSWTSNRPQDNLENSSTLVHGPCIPKPISDRNWELPEELMVFGEWVSILRPLVYVLLIRRYGLKSWKPWLASLALDATGLATILVAAFLKDRRRMSFLQDGHESIDRLPFSSEEIHEVKRRQLLLVLYLTRDPFFSMYTRRWLGVAERALVPVPLIGSLTGKVVEFLTGVQSRFCYISGS